MVVKIADPILMREINKFHVLEAIRLSGQVSRVEISRKTFLSGTTVSAITGALIDEGLIEAVHTQPSEKVGRGRPRVLLQLIADAAFIIGLMISERKISATIANFRGEPVHSIQLPVGVAHWGKDVIVDLIEDTVHECISGSGIDPLLIKGIGIGTPGLRDSTSKITSQYTGLETYQIEIGQELSKRVNLPVRAERSANLIALAESWFEQGGRDQSLAVITIDDKVDLSLVFNGELFRGASGLGPAFGQTPVYKTAVDDTHDQLVSLGGLFSHDASRNIANLVLENGLKNGRVAARGALAKVAEQANKGNSTAVAFFEEQGRALGQAVAHIINLTNPHKIIINFENPSQCVLVERAFNDSLTQHTSLTFKAQSTIVLRELDEDVSVRGAVALMLRDIYSAPWTAQ